MLSLLQTQASNPHEGQKLHYRMCCYIELGSMTVLCNMSFQCDIDILLDNCVCFAHVAWQTGLADRFSCGTFKQICAAIVLQAWTFQMAKLTKV